MLNDRVIRTAFVLSFVGHCLFLGMPWINIRPLQVKKLEDITVRIEIEKPPLLPKIDVMGDEKKIKEIEEDSEKTEPKPEQELKPEEIIIQERPLEEIKEKVEVIDPAQEAMLRYQYMVKQRIEQARRYPSWAERQGIEGAVYINFIVLSSGFGRGVNITRSSGSKILDEEAVATIQRANPFPPIPHELNQDSVSMEVVIVFKIK